jgi:hypothetical protein
MESRGGSGSVVMRCLGIAFQNISKDLVLPDFLQENNPVGAATA